MKNPKFTVEYRRKRAQKTDYRKRLKLLQSNLPRFVVRRQSNKIIAQIVQYYQDGDTILASAQRKDLEKLGWKLPTGNLPGAYLLGYLLGKKAQNKKIAKAILDLGVHTITKGSRIFACLKGAVDAGLDVPHSPEMFPPEDRITGKHIDAYRKTNMQKTFAEVKAKIT